MNAIEVEHLTKRYPGFVLEDVSFTLPSGCVLGLVGENGAGKSTLIRLLMDAVRRDAGTVRLLGADNHAAAFPAVKERVGVVLDEAHFPEVLTPAQIGAVLRRTYRNWDDAAYARWLARFALPNKRVYRLSRGMKMKLAIAAALSHNAELLLLDEATSGLDPMVRDEILDVFNDFTRDEAHSILLSSHIVSDLEKICDYIALLHRGRLVLFEEKDRLLEEYALVRLTRAQFEAVPPEAVVGKKTGAFGVEALVRRAAVTRAIVSEHTSLEEIILFYTKGEDAA